MCINREAIKMIRLKKGMKRNEVAFKLDTSESVIWSCEEDKNYNPRICTLQKLAELYGVELKEILL